MIAPESARRPLLGERLQEASMRPGHDRPGKGSRRDRLVGSYALLQ